MDAQVKLADTFGSYAIGFLHTGHHRAVLTPS